MTPRLASRIEVSALLRRIEGQGGTGVVVAKGDGEAGAILLLLAERGVPKTLLERVLDVSGSYRWQAAGPHNIEGYEEVNAYTQRRRRIDDDLWIVELDIAGVQRFAAELISAG
jgi:hypothetical protein